MKTPKTSRSSAAARLVSLLLLAAVALPACNSQGRGRGKAGTGGATAGNSGGTAPLNSSGGSSGGGTDPSMVTLTDADLAPVDGYIRKRRWILGDEVDVTASKEYFSPNLTIVSRVGTVRQEESLDPNGATVTLTYLGPPGTIDPASAPRMMIGIGITVTARRVIRIHLVRTMDPNLPVRLSISARGKASTGVAETVERRSDDITIGGTLRKEGAAYRWEETAR